MARKKEPPPEVLRLAAHQEGVLTSAQLKVDGIGRAARRRWIAGWVRMAHGVYCVSEPTWLSWCWAGLLLAGDTGVITGLAAGHLHGFVNEPPGRITIYHRRTEGMAPIGDAQISVRFRRGEREGRGQLRRASVEQSVVDLAGEAGETTVIAAVTRAVAQELTTSERVVEKVRRLARLRHRERIEAVCAEAATGVQSVLELLFLQRVCRPHGIPEPTRQTRLLSGTRTDCHWDEFRVVAELDGRLGHEDEPFRDMHRDNRFARKGMLSLRYGWHDTTQRYCQSARELSEVLQLQGWEGASRECPACAAAEGTATSAPRSFSQWG